MSKIYKRIFEHQNIFPMINNIMLIKIKVMFCFILFFFINMKTNLYNETYRFRLVKNLIKYSNIVQMISFTHCFKLLLSIKFILDYIEYTLIDFACREMSIFFYIRYKILTSYVMSMSLMQQINIYEYEVN